MKKALTTVVEPVRNLSATAFVRTKRLPSTIFARKSRVALKYLHICISCVYNNEKYLIPFRHSRKMTSEDFDECESLINSNVETLTLCQRIAYGFGHVFNDICAAMWFSYLLFYLQIILEMGAATAGFLLMIGQISDAIATPIAGWAVDKFGTRTSWHFAGTAMVAISFPMVFTSCNLCEQGFQQMLYHVFFIVFFQIGWAIVQISHLSIIPNLSSLSARRSELTAIRYTAAVCSSLAAYLVTWIILRSNSTDSIIIGPADYYKFKEIMVVILVLGGISTVIFYTGIKWQNFNMRRVISKDSASHIPIKKILSTPLIYQISLLYVASRLYMTLNLVYMPLYLDERVTANMSPSENLRESLASVPLVSFIASFITSLILKNRTEQWGNKATYFVGSLISFSTCFWIALYLSKTTSVFYVYAVAIFIGTGSSVTIITSLCLTAEVIGPNISRGASVYSIVTFTDKLICGIVVVIIEHLKCQNKLECPEYYRYVLAYVSGGAALFGLLTLCTLILPKTPKPILLSVPHNCSY